MSTVLYFVFTSIFTGFYKDARSSLATFDVIVAENKNVFRSFGIYPRIKLIYFSKSILKSLSASSKIKNPNFFIWNPFVFAKWSATRPGVPTITCGFLERAIAYDTISKPPTKTAVLNPIKDPIASNYSEI